MWCPRCRAELDGDKDGGLIATVRSIVGRAEMRRREWPAAALAGDPAARAHYLKEAELREEAAAEFGKAILGADNYPATAREICARYGIRHLWGSACPKPLDVWTGSKPASSTAAHA